jgi:hypothetical protein
VRASTNEARMALRLLSDMLAGALTGNAQLAVAPSRYYPTEPWWRWLVEAGFCRFPVLDPPKENGDRRVTPSFATHISENAEVP